MIVMVMSSYFFTRVFISGLLTYLTHGQGDNDEILELWAAQSGSNGRLSCPQRFKIVWHIKFSLTSN